ncbi:MAG TPA: YicC/YloC family endoribonuclease [Longimicrobiaceae bacterium]|nr:YicC/YloC family endoribonuclease [Longimicrobiaceae bacterium]
MIRSMTGYGEAESAISVGLLRAELRSVNHRYLNVNIRVPSSLGRFESDIREWLREPFSRGHVNCTIRLEPSEDNPSGALGLSLDEDRIASYLALFQEMASRFNLPGTPDIALLSKYNDIFIRADPDTELAAIPADAVRDVVLAAARQTLEMREDEGRRLHDDLSHRLEALSAALAAIESLAPARLSAERDRLRDAVGELLAGRPLNEDRVAQEIVMLAERWDVNEEIVRFRSHIELFDDLLQSEMAEPVGKRLSFLVQEMHREANTIGSKANSAAIAHSVVGMKDEIERLREQVENVE